MIFCHALLPLLCPCSFAMSIWLFPPQHRTVWAIQPVLNKQTWLKFKWFVQPKLHTEISFSHALCIPLQSRDWLHGSGLCNTDCLGCWPCRTAKVASSSLAIPSKSLEQLVTLMIWKKCWPQTYFFVHFALEHFEKRRDKDWASMFATCAVSSWFAFMSNAVP